MDSPSEAPSYRALLAVPTIGRILVGMTLSRIAGGMLGVAMVLFTLDRYASPLLAGIVTLTSIAPGLLVSPLAGALLDRHGRARLIILDQVVAGASLLLIAGLAVADALPAQLLVLITVVASLTAPLSNTGLRSLFPLLVPKPLWERVNALDSNGYVVATLVGPPAAGVLVQVVGGPGTLVSIALLHALAAVVLVGIADPKSPVASSGRLLVDAWQGLVYTLRNPTLRALGVSISVLNLGGGVLTILIPLIVLRGLGQGEAVVGAAWAISGLTGGLAAIVVGRWRTRGRERAMLAWPMFALGLVSLLLLLPPNLALLFGVMALTGFANGPLDVAMFTLRQRRTDPAWTGRAFAVSMSLNFMGYPVGSAIAGALVESSLEPAILFGATTAIAAAVLAWWLIPESGRESWDREAVPA